MAPETSALSAHGVHLWEAFEMLHMLEDFFALGFRQLEEQIPDWIGPNDPRHVFLLVFRFAKARDMRITSS